MPKPSQDLSYFLGFHGRWTTTQQMGLQQWSKLAPAESIDHHQCSKGWLQPPLVAKVDSSPRWLAPAPAGANVNPMHRRFDTR